MHCAKEVFVSAEASEKKLRTLRHNVRVSGDTRYFVGDYFIKEIITTNGMVQVKSMDKMGNRCL